MKIVVPDFEILTPISEGGMEELKRIERIARVCYKSEDKISENGTSAEKLIRNLIKNGHEAMLEHSQLSVLFTVDRGVSHELVRHRLCSFAQESTRWCNYSNDKFGNELTFVMPTEFIPIFYNLDEVDPDLKFVCLSWKREMESAEDKYLDMLEHHAAPQLARAVLPNSLKTELVVTANYREWRHIFKLRCAKDAHPDMQWIMKMLLAEVHNSIPVIFDDIVEAVWGDNPWE